MKPIWTPLVGTESAADRGADTGGPDGIQDVENAGSPDHDAFEEAEGTAGQTIADARDVNAGRADENRADGHPAGANLAKTGAARVDPKGEGLADAGPETRSGPEPVPGPAVGPTPAAAAVGGAADRSSGLDAGAAETRWRGERVGIREGIEVRAGLATLLGRDERPGEIPGLGPVDAEVARRVVAAQRRGAEWIFAVVDDDGYLLLAGPLRRRPRPGAPPGTGPPGPVWGGVVELHITLAELRRFGVDPGALGDWAGVVAEIADQWAERHRLWRRLSRDPRARFARGAVARHVRVRDRTCVGPGCTRSARRSDLDHTRDHSRGGDTVEANIGPGCRRHHPDKGRGWTLAQPAPGLFVWRSPLGRTYRTRGEPVRPDRPDPEPPEEEADPRAEPEAVDGGRLDLRILWRPPRDPAPPPPPPDDEEEPPF